jgi:hypothetical protein
MQSTGSFLDLKLSNTARRRRRSAPQLTRTVGRTPFPLATFPNEESV